MKKSEIIRWIATALVLCGCITARAGREDVFVSMDKDKDGRVTHEEFMAVQLAHFERSDKDKDGVVSDAEFPPASVKRGDLNGDGKLDRDEFGKLAESLFKTWDKNGDGTVAKEKVSEQASPPTAEKPGGSDRKHVAAETPRIDTSGTPQEQVLALGKLTTVPLVLDAAGFAAEGDLRPICFNALPWKGNATRVFAWLGVPKKQTGKMPGIVLVHGGGGTAFKEWVKKWNDHGYAAISIAVEGQTDVKGPKGPDTTATGWKRHQWAGPERVGIYDDSAEPLQDQWMFHAVADTVLANSLLRSLPEVDADKVGIMGISWGGVITSTMIGIDPRFAFAIPTYGCGHLSDAENQYGKALGNNQTYREVWDPMVRMENAKMPVLWFSWPQDEHFPMGCQAECYRAAPGPHMVSLIPGMHHGHGAGWNPPDSYAFADSVVRDGKPWCVQTKAELTGDDARVSFTSAKPLDRAVLISTVDTGFTGKRKWNESPASLERQGEVWLATTKIPSGTTAWFINVRSGELTASSDYQETGKTK